MVQVCMKRVVIISANEPSWLRATAKSVLYVFLRFTLCLFNFFHINDDPFHRRHFVFLAIFIFQTMYTNIDSLHVFKWMQICALTVSHFFSTVSFKLEFAPKKTKKRNKNKIPGANSKIKENKHMQKKYNNKEITRWIEFNSSSVSYVITRPRWKIVMTIQMKYRQFWCAAKLSESPRWMCVWMCLRSSV